MTKFLIISGSALTQDIIQQGSRGAGYNGAVLINSSGSVTTGEDATGLVITNVQPYSMVEAYASNISLINAYYS